MLKPLFARVLLKREKETVTRGGIHIPETVAKRHAGLRCEVIVNGS